MLSRWESCDCFEDVKLCLIVSVSLRDRRPKPAPLGSISSEQFFAIWPQGDNSDRAGITAVALTKGRQDVCQVLKTTRGPAAASFSHPIDVTGPLHACMPFMQNRIPLQTHLPTVTSWKRGNFTDRKWRTPRPQGNLTEA